MTTVDNDRTVIPVRVAESYDPLAFVVVADDDPATAVTLLGHARVVNAGTTSARLYLDGKLFPYATVDGYHVDLGKRFGREPHMPGVTFTVVAKTVEVVDSLRSWASDGREPTVAATDETREWTVTPVHTVDTRQPVTGALTHVIRDLVAERAEQDSQWGEQNHRDGTGGVQRELERDMARAWTQHQAAENRVTWADILTEEYREALAESDPVRLRGELVQLMATAAVWIEHIDRRARTVAVHLMACPECGLVLERGTRLDGTPCPEPWHDNREGGN